MLRPIPFRAHDKGWRFDFIAAQSVSMSHPHQRASDARVSGDALDHGLYLLRSGQKTFDRVVLLAGRAEQFPLAGQALEWVRTAVSEGDA
jgi:hypothetical protein